VIITRMSIVHENLIIKMCDPYLIHFRYLHRGAGHPVYAGDGAPGLLLALRPIPPLTHAPEKSPTGKARDASIVYPAPV
jgi:hypothetical protein